MANICIIPARGGSKRIPGKNIKPFLAKPIIAYAIQLAAESQLFDEIMVSTDDEEIANIAKKYKANIPFMRSGKNANDFATTADCIEEVLEKYDAKFDWACCIYPTAVLAQSEDIKKGFNKIKQEALEAVFPVVAFDYPIWRSLKVNEEDQVEMNWPEFARSRSQDLPKAYHDAGQWYWFDPESFKQQKRLFMNKSGYIEKSINEVQDIDTAEDWALAELKYQLLNKK
ncbi:pseudaminic acid cytidylyltransferase [Marivirga sp.]|uniref:pseudaminic acid cytidylyltransferase n=1 Tax=Marivirga sp. TaxID=2018662 RepID=UPI0025EA22CA|nr:pseudaminic acid cytidylyltransferase [Marivirga sp.]